MKEETLAQRIDKQVKRMRQIERVRYDLHYLSLDVNDKIHTLLDQEWNEAVHNIHQLSTC